MDYTETQAEVMAKIETISDIIENAFHECDDSLENMDEILIQINKQVVEGRELLKKLSHHERMRGMQL